MACIRAAFFLT